MMVRRLFPSGAIEVSDVVDGCLVTQAYYGYSRRECRDLFRRWLTARKREG